MFSCPPFRDGHVDHVFERKGVVEGNLQIATPTGWRNSGGFLL